METNELFTHDFLGLSQPNIGEVLTVDGRFGLCRAGDLCQCRVDIDEAKELQKDRSERALFKQIDRGDITAIKYYLSTQAKDRGYIERVDWAMAFSGKVDHTVTLKVQEIMAELEGDDQILNAARQSHPFLRVAIGE